MLLAPDPRSVSPVEMEMERKREREIATSNGTANELPLNPSCTMVYHEFPMFPIVSPDSEPSIEHGAIPTGTCSKASALVVELPDPSACYLDLPR